MKFLNSIVISILLNLIWIDTSDSAEVQALELTPKKIKSIDSFIKDAQSKGYSGYISVNVNGQRVISRATGKRNIEANLPNTLNTVFDFGSNTKQYTAAAIMKLFEAGKLNLNQPLSDFFPDISPEKSVITIHHLLTHTAGFKESSGSGLNALSKADFLKQVLASPLAFEVGERFSYSNVGYGILAAIIEQVSEISYEAYLQQVLFSPLKMRSA